MTISRHMSKCLGTSRAGWLVFAIAVISFYSHFSHNWPRHGSFLAPQTSSGGDDGNRDREDAPFWAQKHVAVISATIPPKGAGPDASEWYYLFYVPITARGWTRIGVSCLVILVGSEGQWMSHPATKLAVDTLKRLNGNLAKVYFLSDAVNNASYDHNVKLSQVSRLYGALILRQMLPTNSKKFMNESAFWVTTGDADMLPVDDVGYLRSPPSSDPGMIRIVEPHGCCGFFTNKKLNITVWMHAISFITMTVATWDKVMRYGNIGDGSPVRPEVILKDFEAIFGDMARKKVSHWNGDEWWMDQHLISIRIVQHFNQSSGANPIKSPPTKMRVLGRNSETDRVNRINWNGTTEPYIAGVRKITDAHLFMHGYKEDAWNKSVGFFTKLFGKEEYAVMDEYRNGFVAAKDNPNKQSS